MFWPLLRLCPLNQHEKVTNRAFSAETSLRSTANISRALQKKRQVSKIYLWKCCTPGTPENTIINLKQQCGKISPSFTNHDSHRSGELGWAAGCGEHKYSEERTTPRNCAEGTFGYEEMAEGVLENTGLMTWWHIKKWQMMAEMREEKVCPFPE